MSCGLAGVLRERVLVERPDEARDALGGRGGDWIAEGAAWALLEPAGRGGDVRGDAREAMPRFRVLMRARGDVAPGWRLVWRGAGLMVAAVERDPRAPDRMVLLVETMREDPD